MRWFNLKFFYVVGHLMLTGVLCIPSLGRATEVFPESLESLSSTQNTAVFSVSAEQWNAPCMEEQV